MQQISKNTVPKENQLKMTRPILYDNKEGTGKRILFVGNSITRHGCKPELGWLGEHGMAASSAEMDYVHLVMKEIRKQDPDAACCILQVADWERNYQHSSVIIEQCEEARQYNADVIILRFVENCDYKNFEENIFVQEYKKVADYLNLSGSAKVIATTSFWKHPADDTILRISKECGYQSIYLGDLGEDDNMKAIGKFEHTGVANHPGDLGMEMIAKRIMQCINAE